MKIKRVNPDVYLDRTNSWCIAKFMVIADLSIEDVAEVLHVNPGTIRTKLYRDSWSMEDFIRFINLVIHKMKESFDYNLGNDLDWLIDIYDEGGIRLQ